MINDRERFLMQQAINASEYYKDVDTWLNEIIDDAGGTVEMHLSYDADRHALGVSKYKDSGNVPEAK